MSGSITESDACGNDWDNTWIPPTGTDPSNLPFSWKNPWKNVDVSLVDHSGQREIISDDTGLFMPVKVQYQITHRLHQLQTAIHKIHSLDVQSIQTGDEFLEITTKTDVHLGAGGEIATVLLNELEDIYLKVIPRLPFTCKIAEELFQSYYQIMMVRDESKVYVVGPLSSKTLISNTIDQFNHLISKQTVSFNEKWKIQALGYLDAVSFLLQQYPNVSINVKEYAKQVLFQGSQSDVQNAVKELNDIILSVHVKNIPLDSLVGKLLLCPEASALFSSILERQQMAVSWSVEGDNLFVVSKEIIPIGTVHQLLVENFVVAGFSTGDNSPNDFIKSESFLDTMQKNENSLLVVNKESTGFKVASTKAIMRHLLQREHICNNMVCESVQVNDAKDEITKLCKELKATETQLQSVIVENQELYTANESSNDKVANAENQIAALMMEREELQCAIQQNEEKELSKDDQMPAAFETLQANDSKDETAKLRKELNATNEWLKSVIDENEYLNEKMTNAENQIAALMMEREELQFAIKQNEENKPKHNQMPASESVQANKTEDEIAEMRMELNAFQSRFQSVIDENESLKHEMLNAQSQIAALRLEREECQLTLQQKEENKHYQTLSAKRVTPAAKRNLQKTGRFSTTFPSFTIEQLEKITFLTTEGLITKVYTGSILQLNVECIVNATNQNLMFGGGISQIIASAAGRDLERESEDYIRHNGPIKVEECCTTSAGKLHYKKVIHTVGPRWHDYTDKKQCAALLKKSVLLCCYEADKNGITSIALPSISAGIFGVPKEVCCAQYAYAVEEFSRRNGHKTSLKEIHFVDKDTNMITLIQQEFLHKFN